MKINDDLSYLKHILDLDLHISVLEHLLSYGHDKCVQEMLKLNQLDCLNHYFL